ncbi:MAG: hypothetical protein JW862_11140 [Anaerolineales bacterium]|nr:hypothetical protein [Anaerolineales bacterium]
METLLERISRLKEEIAELKARWPAHSVQAWQVLRLEELEEELAKLQARWEASQAPPKHRNA